MLKKNLKRTLSLACLLFFCSTSIGLAAAYRETESEWTGNFNLMVGSKLLDEVEWWPADEQTEYGAMLDFRHRSWPLNLAVEVLSAEGDGTAGGDKFTSKTREFNIGVKKYWWTLIDAQAYLGGGVSLIEGEFSGLGLSETDEASGIWLAAGILWLFGDHYNVGVDIQASSADVTLFGVDADAGGGHLGFVLGYHW